jgi:hypothetical protein
VNILDRSIVTRDEMYDVVVNNVDEWEAACAEEWKVVTGSELTADAKGSWNFIRVRCISEERAEWGTTRNAIRSIKGSTAPTVGDDSHSARGVPSTPPAPIAGEPPRVPGRVTTVTRGPMQPRFYSYWANAWAAADGSTFVFAGGMDSQAHFFRVDGEGTVSDLGALLPFDGTTEGWYWDADGWIYIPEGPRLLRANPFTKTHQVAFDISTAWPGHRLWQVHSSADGQCHCATLQRTDDWSKVATVIAARGELWKLDAMQPLDESDIDEGGEYVVIKEGDDNRIVTVADRQERWLRDREGAVGHSGMGRGWMVGEDNINGKCVWWDLRTLTRRDLFSTWNMGHLSVRGNRILHSDGEKLGLLDPEGTYRNLLNHAARVVDYDSQVRANLSPCGTRACYMVNGAVFLLEVP